MENYDKASEDLESDEEILGRAEGREEALRALASYAAFQLKLLHHFADEPAFAEVSISDQKQALVVPGKSVIHFGRLSEDSVPDSTLDIGLLPEDGSETML